MTMVCPQVVEIPNGKREAEIANCPNNWLIWRIAPACKAIKRLKLQDDIFRAGWRSQKVERIAEIRSTGAAPSGS
jgi:hypothetical protein